MEYAHHVDTHIAPSPPRHPSQYHRIYDAVHSSGLANFLGHAFPCNTTFILQLGGVTCPYTTTQSFQNTWSTVSRWVKPWATRQFPALWIIHLHRVIPHMSITTSQRSPMPLPFVVPSPILHSNLRFKLTHWWQHPRNTLKCVESSWTYPTLKVPLLITAYLEIHIWVCHTNSKGLPFVVRWPSAEISPAACVPHGLALTWHCVERGILFWHGSALWH